MHRLLLACALLGASAAGAETVFEPSLRLRVEERYDDDLRLADGRAGGQLMTKLTPMLGLQARDARLSAEGFYAADLLMRHGSGNVSLDHRAGLDVRQELSRRMRVDGRMRLFRVTDPTSLPRDGVARSTAPTLFGQARLALTGQLSQRLGVRAAYGFEGARVYEAGRRPGYVHVPSLELLYEGTRRLTWGLEYRYQDFTLGEEASSAHGAFAGVRYRLTRLTTLSLRGGPVFFRQQAALGPSGLAPRVALELAREGELTEWAFIAGHDLVGGSGLTGALWADYASLMGTRRFSERLSVRAAASYFRNGLPPGQDFFQARAERLAQGYALGASLEYRWSRHLTVQGALDRVAQVGAVDTGVEMTRNVAALRLILSAW